MYVLVNILGYAKFIIFFVVDRFRNKGFRRPGASLTGRQNSMCRNHRNNKTQSVVSIDMVSDIGCIVDLR